MQQKGEGPVLSTAVPKCSTAVFYEPAQDHRFKNSSRSPAQDQQLAMDDALGGRTRKESSIDSHHSDSIIIKYGGDIFGREFVGRITDQKASLAYRPITHHDASVGRRENQHCGDYAKYALQVGGSEEKM
jgi:hypothetical protein